MNYIKHTLRQSGFSEQFRQPVCQQRRSLRRLENKRIPTPKLKIKLGSEILRVSNLYSPPYLMGIDFSLRKGEVLGIMGLAGSGRSKIARSIFGLNQIESGEIFVNQNKVNIRSSIDAINAGIAYVTEDRSAEGLFPRLKIYENLSATNLKNFRYTFPISPIRVLNLSKEKKSQKNTCEYFQLRTLPITISYLR